MDMWGSEGFFSLVDGPEAADDFNVSGGCNFLGTGHEIWK